jgi:hypothetical protein
VRSSDGAVHRGIGWEVFVLLFFGWISLYSRRIFVIEVMRTCLTDLMVKYYNFRRTSTLKISFIILLMKVLLTLSPRASQLRGSASLLPWHHPSSRQDYSYALRIGTQQRRG